MVGIPHIERGNYAANSSIFFTPVAAPPHCARSSDVHQLEFFEISRLSDCAGF
jgi:hypothetical protein